MTWRISVRSPCGYRLGSISRRHFSITHNLLNERKQQSNFLEDFIKSHNVSQNTIDYFTSVPWTRRVLENEDYKFIPFFSRYLNEQTGENRFFAKTANTNATIPHLLALKLKDFKNPKPTPNTCTKPWQPYMPIGPQDQGSPHPLICLVCLGRGLDSHPFIVHGGFQGVLFDEIMRNLILLDHNSCCKPGPRDIHFTVNMKISYFAPVTTPGIYLLRSQLIRKERRKWLGQAEIVDGNNKVLTSGESTWVTAKKR